MAVVHRAVDEELSRPVAVKILAEHLARDPDFRERFLREARLAGGLSHPHVVGVYDAGEADGVPYIVMELVEGETLADVLARRGRLPPEEAVELGRQAAAGLGEAHARGLVHRDVKPQNLLLRGDGRLEVADFGIARAATSAERLTQVGTVLGTAAYLAPEQAAGEDVTPAADVYSLGVVLYETLTGRLPFPAGTLAELAAAQAAGEVRPVRDLAPQARPELEQLLMRCLARNPEYRPADGAELARLLDGGESAPTRPLPGRPRRSRRRPLLLLAALAAAGAIAAAAIALTGGGASTRPLPPDAPGKPAQQARDLADWLREAGG